MRKLTLVLILLAFLTACTSNPGHYSPKLETNIPYCEDIDDLFAHYYTTMVTLDPQLTQVFTSRPIPLDIAPDQKSKLTPVSIGYREWQVELAKNTLVVLEQYNDDNLTQQQRVNKAILVWNLELIVDGEEFIHNDILTISDLANRLIPFFIDQHSIETLEDAENYLARLEQIPSILAQMQTNLEMQLERNLVPPARVLSLAVNNFINFQSGPIQNNRLRQDFVAKVDSLGEIDSLVERCDKILQDSVLPAYGDLIKKIQEVQPHAVEKITHQPNGHEYYAWLIRQQTNSNLTPEQIHQIALDEVTRLEGEIVEVLTDMGYAGDSYQEIIMELQSSTAIDKDKVVDRYTELLELSMKLTPQLFNLLPQTPVEIHGTERLGHHYRPPIDGSMPGIFMVNTPDTYFNNEISAKWLVWHETMPGHHLQIALEQEMGKPYFRDLFYFLGYVEGWGSYAEFLFFEHGMVDDKIAYVGALHRQLMLAARVVTETGFLIKDWDEQQAVQYFIDKVGYDMTTSNYIIRPGRDVAYFTGMVQFRDLRQMAQSELGDAFDIKEFHDLVIRFGSMPFSVLEVLVEEYIIAKSQ